MTTVLEQTSTELFTVFPVHLNQIRVDLNSRYGWESNRIIEAYKSKIEELKDSIASEGFKKTKPVEVYDTGERTDEGLIIYGLEDGHRRYQSSVELYSVNQKLAFGKGLQPGEIWGILVEKPASVLDRIRSQIASNKSQENTKMDMCKAITLAFQDMQERKFAKSKNLEAIGKAIGMSRANTIIYMEMFNLADPIKDWIQESELNPAGLDVTLGFSMAAEIVASYKIKEEKDDAKKLANANTILLSALAEAESNPEDVKKIGKAVTKEYLHGIARDLNIKSNDAPTKEDSKLKGSSIPAYSPEELTAQSDIHPHTPSTPTNINKEYNDDFGFDADVDSTLDAALERGEKPQSLPVLTQDKNTSKSVSKSESDSIERIKTKLLKLLLSPEISACIVDGKADVSTGKFLIEIPMNQGIELAELLQSAVDPRSNPIPKTEADLIDELGDLTGF